MKYYFIRYTWSTPIRSGTISIIKQLSVDELPIEELQGILRKHTTTTQNIIVAVGINIDILAMNLL